jgi:putative transposase
MLRLETSEQDNLRLLDTMRKYNDACDFVADNAFSLKLMNRCKLHRIVYTEIRERFGLGSQLAIRISVYKRDKNIKPRFKPFGLIQCDQRNCRIWIDTI